MESIDLHVFDGGRNTKANILDVPVHMTPAEQNIIYDDFGAIQSRRGKKTHNTAEIAAQPIDGLASYKPSTMSAQMIAICNGAAHIATGAATAFTPIPSSVTVWTANTPNETEQFQDLLFFSNGNVKPYKFDGTQFTQAGISAPTQALTAATNSAGSISGSIVYVYTGVNTFLAESDYGGATATFVASNEEIKISNIPTAPASSGVGFWNIFRNTAGAEGLYWYVTCVNNGVTSTTDVSTDSDLTLAAPLDQGFPRNFKYMLNFGGRLWGAGESANPEFLWFSRVNQPEEFPALNFIRVGRGDGMQISGLEVQSSVLIISKSDFNGKNAIYHLYMGDSMTASTPTLWNMTKANSPQGSESHRAMVKYSNLLTLVNRSGVFAFVGKEVALNPTETDKGNLSTDAISFNIETDILGLEPSILKNAAAINWKNKVWFSVPNSGASNNNRVLQYDYVNMSKSNRVGGAWGLFTNHEVSQFAIHENGLYGGDDTAGYVHQLDTGRNDGGSAIDAYFTSGPLKGSKKHWTVWKDFRWMEITVETTGAWNLLFSYSTDSDTFTSEENISMGAAGSETNKVVKVLFANSTSGYYAQLKFRINTADQHFIIKGFRYTYQPRGIRK